MFIALRKPGENLGPNQMIAKQNMSCELILLQRSSDIWAKAVVFDKEYSVVGKHCLYKIHCFPLIMYTMVA